MQRCTRACLAQAFASDMQSAKKDFPQLCQLRLCSLTALTVCPVSEQVVADCTAEEDRRDSSTTSWRSANVLQAIFGRQVSIVSEGDLLVSYLKTLVLA